MLGFQADPRTSAKGVVIVDPENQRSFGTDNPLPVASGPRSTFTVNVANGASLSAALDLGNYTAARVGMPATITGTGAITFQVSHDGITYKDLYDKDGVEYKIATSGASRSFALNVSDFLSIRYLKVRFGTSASPQAQGQSTDVTVTGVA